MWSDPVIVWISRLTLSVIFASAAYQKLHSLDEFQLILSRYALLPPPLLRPVANSLPVLELATAAALLIPTLHVVATGVALALLTVFTLVLLITLRRGRGDIDCGCHLGATPSRVSPGLVARNGVLLLWGEPALQGGEPVRSLGVFDAFTMVMGTAVALLCYLMASELSRAQPSAWSR